jgi:hypothetical protein
MKLCRPWLLVGFVLAIFLILGLRPDRPTRVSLDSLIGPASYPDLSHLCIPRVKPAKFTLQLEARRTRAGPDECLPLLFSNFSLDHPLLPADDTGPPWIDLHGPPVLVPTAPRVEVARPAGRVGPQRGETPIRTRENRASGKNRSSATCNFLL